MANLPEQAHQRGTAVATRDEVDPYALDQSMITLPRLMLVQYQSKAFKAKRADYGDIIVGIGSDDSAPAIVAKAGDPLGEPVRYYVHNLQAGFDTAQGDDPKKVTDFGRPGGTFNDALGLVGGDPRRVYQKFFYTLTIPAYEVLPVRFIMASRWGARSGRWVNTQIGILRQQGVHPLTRPFQVQTRSANNAQGDFVEAVVDFAKVTAKQAAADAELVQQHAELLATRTIQDADDDYATADAVDTTAAPSLG